MAQITWTPRYMEKKDFPVRGAKVYKVDVTESKKYASGQAVSLEFVVGSKHYVMDVWGDNLKTFIDALGNETDNWKEALFDYFLVDDKFRIVNNVRKG